MKVSVLTAYVLALSLLQGCKCSREEPAAAAADAAAAPQAQATTAETNAAPEPTVLFRPTGPALAIQAGRGVGAIWIGATVKTIERQMAAPCDVKTDELCRYLGRAVEFHLDDEGATRWIYVHRQQRPTQDADGKPTVFGQFNGAIPPDLMFGMTPEAIQEGLGKPKRVEKLEPGDPNDTVERHYYDGMQIEYDRWKNGKLIMGGVRLVKE